MSNTDVRLLDVILPIVEVEITQSKEVSLKFLLGTGFLINNSRNLLTASHVIKAGTPGYAVALRVIDGYFETIQLDNIRHHPTEDATLCDVNIPNHPQSWINPTSIPQHQAADCHIWGYPVDVLYDADQRGSDGRFLQRPELIFTKTYIRRRFSQNRPPLIGSKFYEIGDSAGAGCSGRPVFVPIRGINWNAIGIYTGQNISKTGEDPERFRGYVTRMEALTDWLAAEGVNIIK